MNKLMLFSGAEKREGWMTLDVNPEYRADIIANVYPLPVEVLNNIWDEIEWIHGINCMTPWSGMLTLESIRHAMAPDGILILEQPDMRKVVTKYAQDESLMRWIFGDPSGGEDLGMARWGYTPESLTDLVKSVGFTRIKIEKALHHLVERDFRLEAQP
jgi:hypothetical protein